MDSYTWIHHKRTYQVRWLKETDDERKLMESMQSIPLDDDDDDVLISMLDLLKHKRWFI